MAMAKVKVLGLAAGAAILVATAAWAQHDMKHDGSMHGGHHGDSKAAASGHSHDFGPDTREFVKYPDKMREHTLAGMRDHLKAIQEIQVALSQEQFDAAARVAEQRLGMSSLGRHGAEESSKVMPAGMAAIGTQMHRSASQFAIVARDASTTGDVKATLKALSNLTAQCVACHAAYKLHE
ncbi:MAG: hypothetical protein RL357_324 [Pseudomonadota bacterium]|jgi:hypothetical protein